MEQRWNERAGETGDHRENPPTEPMRVERGDCRSTPERGGRGKREIPEKIRLPEASSSGSPTCESPGAAPPGLEPGQPSTPTDTARHARRGAVLIGVRASVARIAPSLLSLQRVTNLPWRYSLNFLCGAITLLTPARAFQTQVFTLIQAPPLESDVVFERTLTPRRSSRREGGISRRVLNCVIRKHAGETKKQFVRGRTWVARPLASHQDDLGSIPGRATPGSLQVGIVADDAAGRRVFLGVSRSFHLFNTALVHTSVTPIGSQDLAILSRPSPFTHSDYFSRPSSHLAVGTMLKRRTRRNVISQSIYGIFHYHVLPEKNRADQRASSGTITDCGIPVATPAGNRTLLAFCGRGERCGRAGATLLVGRFSRGYPISPPPNLRFLAALARGEDGGQRRLSAILGVSQNHRVSVGYSVLGELVSLPGYSVLGELVSLPGYSVLGELASLPGYSVLGELASLPGYSVLVSAYNSSIQEQQTVAAYRSSIQEQLTVTAYSSNIQKQHTVASYSSINTVAAYSSSIQGQHTVAEYSSSLQYQHTVAAYRSSISEQHTARKEQRWNARSGEKGDERANPLTSSIVRHDTNSRKSGWGLNPVHLGGRRAASGTKGNDCPRESTFSPSLTHNHLRGPRSSVLGGPASASTRKHINPLKWLGQCLNDRDLEDWPGSSIWTGEPSRVLVPDDQWLLWV
ncbi:hypothetical protein PR048_026939 [Dryococelus australis]|uniref:Uncharacterized protein n=1 Tax=Dryococelus australis TaxID=614101 RepID=A0ABQ9GMS8_9NEOP|nr:hypothetical protein PR048_026939 [Dryococelus australis]